METTLWHADDPWNPLSGTNLSKLAEALTAPLRRRMDYSSIAKKAFSVQELPKGALPMYDKDDSVRSHIWTP